MLFPLFRKKRKRDLKVPARLSSEEKKKIKKVIDDAKKADKVPHSVQESVTFERMFPSGICREVGDFYSKTIQFQDINYKLAQEEDKTTIFEEWCSFLNFFDSSVEFSLTFLNVSTDGTKFEKSIRIPLRKDSFNDVRDQYSSVLKSQFEKGNNGLTKTKYLTFGIHAASIREAKPRLARIETDVLNNFKHLGVFANSLNGKERLKVMHVGSVLAHDIRIGFIKLCRDSWKMMFVIWSPCYFIIRRFAMNIGGIGSVANAYQYANLTRSNKVSSPDFTSSMQEATAENKVDAYKNYLQDKYGVPITVASVGKDQDSMDRFAGGTAGSGNVAIAPNILKQMANDPEKAAYYEKKISDYFNYGVPQTDAFMAMIGHRKTSEGLVIHEDGTVTHYLSGEESPEKVAKFEAEQKAKKEKKAKQAREAQERAKEVAEERHRVQEEMYHNRSIESVLYDQVYNSRMMAYSDSQEGLLSAYTLRMGSIVRSL